MSQLRFPRMAGGANHPSLVEAQANFAAIGAAAPEYAAGVRHARRGDVRDPLWRPIDPEVDSIEDPISGRDYGADYPADAAALYYWRPTYWRKATPDA